jgi:sporulation protein YlmC with PRC-barrel domain
MTDGKTSTGDSAPPGSGQRTLFMRDIVDGQLRTREGRRIGRVADVDVEWTAQGLFLRDMWLGPEAHASRVFGRLGDLLHRLLGGRKEHRILISEVEEIGPNVMLKQTSDAYDVGDGDQWIRDHFFRFIPGSDK